MKTICFALVAIVAAVSLASCSARAGISKSRTGAGVSTPIGGLSGGIHY